jgi:predicted NUDIX family NTP pyrophosphohydrolase
MAQRSAGILMWHRGAEDGLRVLLVHPGGPFWARKDAGAWTIPKGEYVAGEDPLAAARREFFEELGCDFAHNAVTFMPLGDITQKAGKIVTAFAVEGNLDCDAIVSNTFEVEWPPKSGKQRRFPEVDRAAWFSLDEAHTKINPAQHPLLERLATHLQANR